MAELVRRRFLRHLSLLARRVRQLVPLGDDDDREVLAAGVPSRDLAARVLDGDRMLGNEDDVGAAGDPAHDGDPAGVPAHDLDHHHAVVRLGGRVQPVDRLGADPHRRVEAEGVVGARRGRCRSSWARRRQGSRVPRGAAPRRRACPRRRSRRARRGALLEVRSTASTPPSSLYGFVRDVPMIVPPRGRIPEISRGPSCSSLPSTSPRQPSRTPIDLPAARCSRRVTARMTAFSPGQSPPPVRIRAHRAS